MVESVLAPPGPIPNPVVTQGSAGESTAGATPWEARPADTAPTSGGPATLSAGWRAAARWAHNPKVAGFESRPRHHITTVTVRSRSFFLLSVAAHRLAALAAGVVSVGLVGAAGEFVPTSHLRIAPLGGLDWRGSARRRKKPWLSKAMSFESANSVRTHALNSFSDPDYGTGLRGRARKFSESCAAAMPGRSELTPGRVTMAAAP